MSKKNFPNYWLSLQHYLLHIFAIKKMFITLLFLRDIVVRNEPAKSNFCLNRNHCSGRKINLTKFSKIKWCFNFTIFLKNVSQVRSSSPTSTATVLPASCFWFSAFRKSPATSTSAKPAWSPPPRRLPKIYQ